MKNAARRAGDMKAGGLTLQNAKQKGALRRLLVWGRVGNWAKNQGRFNQGVESERGQAREAPSASQAASASASGALLAMTPSDTREMPSERQFSCQVRIHSPSPQS